MPVVFLISLLLVILGSGCDPDQLIQKATPAADEQAATNYISLLRQGRFEPIQNDLDGSLKSVLTRDKLAAMAAAIPPQEPIGFKVIGARHLFDQKVWQINLTFEYQFPTNWVVINVALQKQGGVSSIVGFHVYPLTDSLEHHNRFQLAGKKPFQYLVLLAALLIPLFLLSVAVVCVRTKMKRRKWLWLLFILVGFGTLSVNWTTGGWQCVPLNLLLFGSGAFALPYGPWLISISFPVGAISFLLMRKILTAPAAPDLSADAEEAGSGSPGSP